jgi:drug/metabolite transporter (DMT)-like permease
MGLAPYWIVVTRFSDNLPLAGFIYDFAVAAGWAIGVLLFKGETFGLWQYVGVALMFAGILAFRR